MAARPTIYSDLSRSICPSVYGHDAIKQAILLMLFGGVHKRTIEVGATREGGGRAGPLSLAAIPVSPGLWPAQLSCLPPGRVLAGWVP